MFYIHLNGDDVWLSQVEEPLSTIVGIFEDYQQALRQLMMFSQYCEPQEPIEQYIYEEDSAVWFA